MDTLLPFNFLSCMFLFLVWACIFCLVMYCYNGQNHDRWDIGAVICLACVLVMGVWMFHK